ncbi:MAG TPA: formimidoylglutamate deiminase [Acidimicrobiia bacterium]|nr:formimidoylglutamate deiminase [Acidimicrobiia bacterium]
MRQWWCEHAFVDGEVHDRVRVSCDESGRISEVVIGADQGGLSVLSGVVIPGFANTHSHAFHRALRGRTHERGSFWTWREAMYRVANLLDPDTYLDLATATYAEMVAGGFTAVGEFHYLHHQPGGRRYEDANQMGEVLREAARRAGIRLTLLDACYLTGGIGQSLRAEQARFGDGGVQAWAARFSEFREDPNTRAGPAIHSVRAVPAEAMATVAAAGADRPLHVHVSEQSPENGECLAIYGVTPTALLAREGVLGRHTTAIHATHVEPADIAMLASSDTGVCLCPTTERDLGDGIDPGLALDRAGIDLSLGTDQHSTIDAFEEMRGTEMNQRLRENARGIFSPARLLRFATSNGHEALGWAGGGRIRGGSPCDLVAIDLRTPRTAGSSPDQVIMAATAADIHTVVVGGREVVREGHHPLGDVADLLARAISPLWP